MRKRWYARVFVFEHADDARLHDFHIQNEMPFVLCARAYACIVVAAVVVVVIVVVCAYKIYTRIEKLVVKSVVDLSGELRRLVKTQQVIYTPADWNCVPEWPAR